jgi:hypothetical protein
MLDTIVTTVHVSTIKLSISVESKKDDYEGLE